MARRIQTLLIDDVNGSDADETVTFVLDGREYEIDLTTAHADELREVLGEFLNAARRIGSGQRTGRRGVARRQTPGTGDGEMAAIRAWAKEQGMAVNDRGRISSEIREAYEKRNERKPKSGVTAATFQDGSPGLGSEEKKTARPRAAKATAKK
jgi:hypothetical protein